MANELDNMTVSAKKTTVVFKNTTVLVKKLNSELANTNSALAQFGRSIRTLTTQQQQLGRTFISLESTSYAAAVAICTLEHYSNQLSISFKNVSERLTNFNFGGFKPSFEFKIGPLVEIESTSVSISNTINQIEQNFTQFNLAINILIDKLIGINFDSIFGDINFNFNFAPFIEIGSISNSLSITFINLEQNIYNFTLAINILIDKLIGINFDSIFGGINFNFNFAPFIEIGSISASLAITFINLEQNIYNFTLAFNLLIDKLIGINFDSIFGGINFNFNFAPFIEIGSISNSLVIAFNHLEQTIFQFNLAINFLIDKIFGISFGSIAEKKPGKMLDSMMGMVEWSPTTKMLWTATDLAMDKEQDEKDKKIKQGADPKSLPATTRENFTELQKSFDEFGAGIGTALLPALNNIISIVAPIINAINGWIQKNPELTSTLVQVAVGGLLLKTAISTVIQYSGQLSTIWTVLKIVGTVIGQTFLALGRGILVIGRLLLMTPIGRILTVIGIAAYLIYKNWEPIKEFFSNLWGKVCEMFSGAIDIIANVINNFSPLGLFYNAFAGVMEFFGVSMPETFTEFGGNIIGSLIDGLIAKAEGIINFASSLGNGIKNALGFGSDEDEQKIPEPGKTLAPPKSAAKSENKTTDSFGDGRYKTTDAFPANTAISPTLPPRRPSQNMPVGGAGNKECGFTLNFSPNIRVDGSTPEAIKSQIMAALKMGQQELEQMIKRIMEQQTRRAY